MSISYLQRKRKTELLELAQQANLPEYVIQSASHAIRDVGPYANGADNVPAPTDY
jgi:hypothetical protein